MSEPHRPASSGTTPTPDRPVTPPPPPGSSGTPAGPPAAARRRHPQEGERGTRIALVLGTVVVAVGLWLLLDSFGVPVPDLGEHWPVFLILGGIASAVDWAWVSHRPGSAGQAVVGLGLGILFYLLEMDRLAWSDFDDWWPSLFLIAGLAYLTAWAAGRFQSSRHLTAGLILLGLAATGWGWQLLKLQVMWAVILLAIGAFVLWRTLRGKE